jgi:integrase
MARLGHSSPRAALRYQHVADERDAEVASAMDRLIQR